MPSPAGEHLRNAALSAILSDGLGVQQTFSKCSLRVHYDLVGVHTEQLGSSGKACDLYSGDDRFEFRPDTDYKYIDSEIPVILITPQGNCW
jgi:hypothetical protein